MMNNLYNRKDLSECHEKVTKFFLDENYFGRCKFFLANGKFFFGRGSAKIIFASAKIILGLQFWNYWVKKKDNARSQHICAWWGGGGNEWASLLGSLFPNSYFQMRINLKWNLIQRIILASLCTILSVKNKGFLAGDRFGLLLIFQKNIFCQNSCFENCLPDKGEGNVWAYREKFNIDFLAQNFFLPSLHV